MLFNSPAFAIFFPVVTVGYFLLPHRWRWLWLLGASCYFYMAFVPAYILILFFTIAVDYVAGILIEQTQDARRRRLLLACSLVANVGVLAIFKYFGFLDTNLAALAHWLGWNYPLHTLSLILPIGLSFHTFQAMSYVIEVYRGHQPAERHLGIYALYVMFYPQLVAGPIERPQNLLPQFHQPQVFDEARVVAGLQLMTWGLFKKVVVADRLAVLVDAVYQDPTQHRGIPLIAATYAFAYQIYCDFSGYSDIAIGSAQVMGISLMTNFRQPYQARSIAEFWQRWHISLSTWFRDYVYIPLGGNRAGHWRWSANVLIVFLVSGLWHGANWTFVLWGAIHGVYLLAGRWWQALAARLRTVWRGLPSRLPATGALQMLLTFHLVLVAWVFFRANTVADALHVLRYALVDIQWRGGYGIGGGGAYELAIAAGAILAMEWIQFRQRRGSVRAQLGAWPVWARWTAYYALILSILIFGKFQTRDFVYFQF